MIENAEDFGWDEGVTGVFEAAHGGEEIGNEFLL